MDGEATGDEWIDWGAMGGIYELYIGFRTAVDSTDMIPMPRDLHSSNVFLNSFVPSNPLYLCSWVNETLTDSGNCTSTLPFRVIGLAQRLWLGIWEGRWWWQGWW